MTEAAERAAVVAAARSWICTPYHNCADIKVVGVDCGMLIVRVFVDLELVEPFDPRPYSPDWHLHRSEEHYLDWVKQHCGEVGAPEPGDIMVFRYGRCYSHGGIVTQSDPIKIVHAFAPARVVIEEEVARSGRLARPSCKPRFFSHWQASES